jgi:hypothetical protein
VAAKELPVPRPVEEPSHLLIKDEIARAEVRAQTHSPGEIDSMAKIAKTADRKKVMDTSKSTDCPKCSKPTRIVKRVKDRERGVPGGVYISCSACEFYEKL